VVVDLLTTDAVHVHAGTVVHIAGFGTDDMLAGEVRRVEPSAFTRPSALGVDEQRVNVLISFTAPPERWAALGDGYRVEARLELWRAIDVLQAPHGAVFKHGNEWATFVVEGGRARRVPIQIAHRGEDMVEVVAGLIEGSSIAVHPGDRVQDGVAVLQR
jgi:HlyD family secretion protein